MDPKNDPNNIASSTDKEHSPELGATQPDQQANALRADQGKTPLPADTDHDTKDKSPENGFTPATGPGTDAVGSEEAAKEQAAVQPVASTDHPTDSPASGQQVSANLVKTSSAFSGFSDPASNGESTGEFTISIVRLANDSRSEAQIVYAALSDVYFQYRALGY